jgi:hypothetical protein
VAVDNPGTLNDTEVVGLLRYEMRSAGDARRVYAALEVLQETSIGPN